MRDSNFNAVIEASPTDENEFVGALNIRGELCSILHFQKIEQLIDILLKSGIKSCFIDLSELFYLNSRGLEFLEKITQKYKPFFKKIRHPQPNITMILQIANSQLVEMISC